MPGPARRAARSITSSVPSIASTATTAPSLTAIVWPMSSAAMPSAMPYPNCRSAHSSAVGSLRVRAPDRASSGRRKLVESIRSMPRSASTSATAEIRASVFRALRRRSTESNVRSGTTPANSLVCLTCPAISARETPASFNSAMQRPSCPSDIQCKSVARPSATACEMAGSASSRIAMTVTSCPRSRAASRASSGNRPLPAIRPIRIAGVVVGRFRRSGYSSTPTGSIRLGGRRRLTPRLEVRMNSRRYRTSGQGHGLVLRDAAHGAGGVQLRLQQIAVGTLELGDGGGRESAPHEPRGVEPVDARTVADGLAVRQRVLRHDGIAADERLPADAAELVERPSRR